ncbi:MAG: glycine--tRNA ligase subunit beta [Synergistaceae bacterium]|jgi:glycyl-tRNA synthetase beta chain|nr:glycine--tRNA ligase subunit beta [Synergistaceae bacterium]
MIKRDLLLEIGTEEIPARFMTLVIDELPRMARSGLAELRLGFGAVRVTGTPRRIVLYISDLADRQEDFEQTVKGPPRSRALDSDGRYTKAALGFAGSRGVDVSALKFIEVKGAEYLHAVVNETGRETAGLLPDFLSGLIRGIVFPKSMYWEEQGVRFARPVRWIVALFDNAIVPVRFGNVVSGAVSRGHRFMGPGTVKIDSAGSYETAMELASVIVDHRRRKEMIRDGIAKIERELGGVADDDPDLLEENAQLVEYPVPFLGSFEKEFLDIPEEVLIATMKKNQRYFPVRDRSGRLMASFIGVSNNKARDMGVVRDGSERVLRARLYDAAFFWNDDRRVTLESRLPQLDHVLYQESLGSIRDKSERVRSLAVWLAGEIKEPSLVPSADRAALLSKADLVTGMVFEFPEVQGVMGREYAKRDGESPEVADALFEQYLPRFAGDKIPSGHVGAVIGICDRADSIMAIHKVGLSPTGSQDPYGLRRAARGINEIVWGLGIDVDMGGLFKKAADMLGADGDSFSKAADFCRQRLYNQLREKGHGHGTASLAVSSMGLRPLQALRMLEVFDEASGEPWFESLVLSAVRVSNILNKLPDGDRAAQGRSFAEFTSDQERALSEALDVRSAEVRAALDANDWKGVCSALSGLSGVISGFFDGVMVMDSDPAVRASRVGLLFRCRELFDSIGDFSLLKQTVTA